MMRAGVLVVLAACDLGIGSDPDRVPLAPCLPGQLRDDSAAGCHVATAAIAIDGATDDWAGVPSVTLAPACRDAPCTGSTPIGLWVAAAGASDAGASLIVKVAFDGAPPRADPALRVALTLDASSLQPASAGHDRLLAGVAGIAYEKNGYAVGSATPRPYRYAWTADGLEAAIDGAWLTFQGAATLSVAIERDHGGTWQPIAPSEPLLVCWGWRQSLGPHACEVPLR